MTGSNWHHPDASRGAGARAPDGRAALRRKPDYFPRSTAARITAAFWVLLALPCSVAQSGPTIVGFGPRARLLSVTPGDIVTLQVVGLRTVVPLLPDHSAFAVKASGFPLPTELAGISVTFRRMAINLPGAPVAVPLFSIEQTRICTDELLMPPPPPDCLLTSITVQVPQFSPIAIGDKGGLFAISENGVTSKLSGSSGSTVNIHVLGSGALCGEQQCPAVTHADGTLVTAASPAKPGEVVVIYATGLGETNPPVPAGHATPAPAPAARHGVYLVADFSPNARPRRPYGDPNALPFRLNPEFVGLTPGQVGLYQINVRIPDTIPPVPPCGGGSVAPIRFHVSSNLTITVSGNIYENSFDGAAICVEPPQ